MALEVTASRNFPNRLLRKQSPQNLASSPEPEPEEADDIGGLALHLRQRPPWWLPFTIGLGSEADVVALVGGVGASTAAAATSCSSSSFL